MSSILLVCNSCYALPSSSYPPPIPCLIDLHLSIWQLSQLIAGTLHRMSQSFWNYGAINLLSSYITSIRNFLALAHRNCRLKCLVLVLRAVFPLPLQMLAWMPMLPAEPIAQIAFPAFSTFPNPEMVPDVNTRVSHKPEESTGCHQVTAFPWWLHGMPWGSM